MRDFLLRKDLWALDFLAAVVFGLGVAYWIRTSWRVIDEVTWDRILFEMLLALAGYSATFVVALCLRRKLKFPSWVWMGLVGALAYLALRRVVYFYPKDWKYHKLTSETTSEAIRNALLDGTESVITLWLFLIPFACLFIFAMRFVVYTFRTRYVVR